MDTIEDLEVLYFMFWFSPPQAARGIGVFLGTPQTPAKGFALCTPDLY